MCGDHTLHGTNHGGQLPDHPGEPGTDDGIHPELLTQEPGIVQEPGICIQREEELLLLPKKIMEENRLIITVRQPVPTIRVKRMPLLHRINRKKRTLQHSQREEKINYIENLINWYLNEFNNINRK